MVNVMSCLQWPTLLLYLKTNECTCRRLLIGRYGYSLDNQRQDSAKEPVTCPPFVYRRHPESTETRSQLKVTSVCPNI